MLKNAHSLQRWILAGLLLGVTAMFVLVDFSQEKFRNFLARQHDLAYVVVTSTNWTADWDKVKHLIIANPREMRLSPYITNGLPMYDSEKSRWWYPLENRLSNEVVERGIVVVWDPTSPSNKRAYERMKNR